MDKKIILASASPRRLELLRQIGIEPVVMVSTYKEDEGVGKTPQELVLSNAIGKGMAIVTKVSAQAVVVAADTVVVLDDNILGKPRDSAMAASMLKSLSGRSHRVMTGVAVFYNDRREVAVETTTVKFRTLTSQEIDDYVATGEPLDKAGAYGIQGKGTLLIEGISGCYNNVVGLPLTRLSKLFADLDVIR